MPGTPGEVVTLIPNHSAEIGHERRHDAVPLLHRGRSVTGGIGDPATGGEHADVVIHQLEGVTVTGQNGDPGTRVGRTTRQGADDVVGLEPRCLHVHGPEGLHEWAKVRHLSTESLWGLAPPGLVRGVHSVPERGSGWIPRHDHPGWSLILDDLHGHRRQPVQGVRGHTVGTGDRLGQGEKGPESEAETVDEQNLTVGIATPRVHLRAHAAESIHGSRRAEARQGSPLGR